MKIIVVDDHPLVWEGLKAVLSMEKDIELCGWAGNGQRAEKLVLKYQPDLVLVDLRLPGEYGVDIIKRLRAKVKCRFIVLTSFAEPADIKQAMDEGVEGYVLKEALPEEMVSALRLVNRGRPYFDPGVMQMMMHSNRDGDYLSELTEREMDVLRALAQGLNNRDIAGLICVTENTVKKHVSNILSKLGLQDRTQAALYAVTRGIGSFNMGALDVV